MLRTRTSNSNSNRILLELLFHHLPLLLHPVPEEGPVRPRPTLRRGSSFNSSLFFYCTHTSANEEKIKPTESAHYPIAGP